MVDDDLIRDHVNLRDCEGAKRVAHFVPFLAAVAEFDFDSGVAIFPSRNAPKGVAVQGYSGLFCRACNGRGAWFNNGNGARFRTRFGDGHGHRFSGSQGGGRRWRTRGLRGAYGGVRRYLRVLRDELRRTDPDEAWADRVVEIERGQQRFQYVGQPKVVHFYVGHMACRDGLGPGLAKRTRIAWDHGA